VLELEDVRVRFPGLDLAFSLQAARGEWLAVIGPSGAGKTTLLNLIGGFVAPLSGRILADGRDITRLAPAARPVTTLFQEHNLFAHLSVADNVGLGIDPGLRIGPEDRGHLERALAEVGLGARAFAMPGELSGGERQRVALARALVRDRPILLLDEPLGQLDPALRRDMLELIAALAGEGRLTILMVVHTPLEAARHVDRYLYVEAGRIAAEMSPDALLAGRYPATVARYLGTAAEPPGAAGAKP